MPTDTKNSTANASRSGSASAAACWLTGDCPTTMPARNAPSAIEAPKSSAAPAAIAIANASTVSVNSSRERSRATCTSAHGSSARADSRRRRATSASQLAERERDVAAARPAGPGAPPCAAERRDQHEHHDREDVLDDQPADRDVARGGVEQARGPRARASARPCWRPTAPCRAPAPRRAASRSASAEPEPEQRRDAALAERAGDRDALHRRAGPCRWKCSPTPNISRMTPISASWLASRTSPTKPGVCGPITTPASR